MYKLNILATNKCNAQVLRAQEDSPGVCTFCFRQETDVHTNIETVINVVHKISELPFEKTVTVTGGEPLLFDFIVPLVKELDQCGKNVSLHTNGILLEKYLDKFDGSVRYVSLPFDGHKPKISNYYRGVGYYDIQQKNMKTLRDHGIKIGLHTLLTPYNYNEIEDMALTLLCSEFYDKIWYWYIQSFKKRNKSLNIDTEEYMLNYSDYLDKVEKVRHICPDIDVYPTSTVRRKPTFIDLAGDVFVYSDVTRKNIFGGNILCDDFLTIESFLAKNNVEK